jgi:hypothetical protein
MEMAFGIRQINWSTNLTGIINVKTAPYNGGRPKALALYAQAH